MKKKTMNAFFILTFTTGISKLFNVFNRVILSRYLGEQGIGLYMMIIPTLGICATLAQISIPSAIFKLVADPRYSNKKVMTTGFIITSITTSCIMLLISTISPTISNVLLQNKDTLLPLRSLVLFIPLTTISSILKNYLMGKEEHQTIAKTQLTEDITRFVLTFVFLQIFTNHSISILVTLCVLAMSLSELISIIYLLFHISSFHIYSFKTIHPPLLYNEFFRISLPLTGSRLLHGTIHFLEPVIITSLLLKLGEDTATIQQQYGIMSGYIMSMITMPTFLTTVVYRILLPIFLQNLNHKQKLLTHLYLGLLMCFLISLPFTFIFYFFPDQCLSLLYQTTSGASYLKYLSIPFILYYLQTPLTALLQALGKNKEMFYISVVECVVEIILLIILVPYLKVSAIAYTLLIGILVTLLLSAFVIFKSLFHNHKQS